MNGSAIFFILLSLLAIAVFWALPRRWGQISVAALSLGGLTIVSPVSALWLGTTTCATPVLMQLGERLRLRGLIVILWGGILASLLLATRELETLLWIGGAYFTLRHLHVLLDWWQDRLEAPPLGDYLCYQFFLPVLMAGPIHRYQNFQRQCDRRRWDMVAFFSGAERALFGMALYVVVAGWLVTKIEVALAHAVSTWPSFLADWLGHTIFWIQLYLSLSGLTSLALGLSLMMGLRLEENFDRPWAAPNLVAFWSRWHMTLSHWCRDYVFRPVTALTRLPLIGLLAAMLAMGIWHDTSLYYVMWAGWQSLGIALTRLALMLPAAGSFGKAGDIGGPLIVLGWLSLTEPVILRIVQATSP